MTDLQTQKEIYQRYVQNRQISENCAYHTEKLAELLNGKPKLVTRVNGHWLKHVNGLEYMQHWVVVKDNHVFDPFLTEPLHINRYFQIAYKNTEEIRWEA